MSICSKNVWIILVLLLKTQASNSQETAKDIYRFRADILRRLTADTSEFRFQTAATSFSFAGQYQQALEFADKDPGDVSTVSKSKEQVFMATYRPVDARTFILNKAKQSQIIIFNEAHYNARHRVFVTSLLHELHRLGYNYFAAETFTHDSSVLALSYPILQLGYFTKEPSFGNMVREALAAGFTLVPYETRHYTGPREREIDQAKNLGSLFAKHPNAKAIIYCGFSHIREDSLPSWGRAMAGRLKEYTGIDPYTIDQVELSEHSGEWLENPYYNLIKSNNYSMMVDRQQQPFHSKGVDACLYTPRASNRYNRPNWLFENNRRPYFINAAAYRLRYPQLVKVFLEGDDPATTVPADIIEIEKGSDFKTTALSIPMNKNICLQLEDAEGKVTSQRIVQNNKKRKSSLRAHPLP